MLIAANFTTIFPRFWLGDIFVSRTRLIHHRERRDSNGHGQIFWPWRLKITFHCFNLLMSTTQLQPQRLLSCVMTPLLSFCLTCICVQRATPSQAFLFRRAMQVPLPCVSGIRPYSAKCSSCTATEYATPSWR